MATTASQPKKKSSKFPKSGPLSIPPTDVQTVAVLMQLSVRTCRGGASGLGRAVGSKPNTDFGAELPSQGPHVTIMPTAAAACRRDFGNAREIRRCSEGRNSMLWHTRTSLPTPCDRSCRLRGRSGAAPKKASMPLAIGGRKEFPEIPNRPC